MDAAEGEPGRGRTIALWVGTACVAGVASGLVARVWSWGVQMVATGPATLSWEVQFRWLRLAMVVGIAGGWWAGLKWADATGFLREVSAWRRRWTVLGLLAGTMAATALLSLGMAASTRVWCHLWGNPDGVGAALWGVHGIPSADGAAETE